jgi:hypothetical protein
MQGWMKALKIAMECTSTHPISKLNSQGRVRLSLSIDGNQRGLAKPLKKSPNNWPISLLIDTVEAASP